MKFRLCFLIIITTTTLTFNRIGKRSHKHKSSQTGLHKVGSIQSKDNRTQLRSYFCLLYTESHCIL